MGKPDPVPGYKNYLQPAPISMLGKTLWAYLISLGNPHAVIFTDQLIGIDFETHANLIATHPQFDDGINVSFVVKSDPQHAIGRTYERGAGETLACGSAACAVATALNIEHNTTEAKIQFKGGVLHTRYVNEVIYQKGPAEKIFSGELQL